MGDVLQFKTRARYNWEALSSQATDQQRFDYLNERTTDALRKLVELYQQSGNWDDKYGEIIKRVVTDLQSVCALCAQQDRKKKEDAVTNESR